MKKLSKEQIKELNRIAETENVGYVLNMNCFLHGAKLDTRLNRNEHILPDVNALYLLCEDGKFSPLTEKEKTYVKVRVFNEFWKNHLNYFENFEFFGLQNDFFTNETYNRLLDYAQTYFDCRINAQISGKMQFKYSLSEKSEIKILEQMKKSFPKSLLKKMREVSKDFVRRKKSQTGLNVSLLQQLIANDLAWKDANNQEINRLTLINKI